MGSSPADRHARALLAALAFTAGCTDAVTYVALGHVFTANMTGNTVLLGIALVAGSPVRIARSACAVAGFCLGVALAARVIAERGDLLWSRRVTGALAGEAAVLAVLGTLVAIHGATKGSLYWLIALSGAAMGAQSAAGQAIAVPGVATTFITGTVTGLVAGMITRGDRWGEAPRVAHGRVRLAGVVWAIYLGAAVAGAAAARAVGAHAIWIAAGVAAAITAIAYSRRAELARR